MRVIRPVATAHCCLLAAAIVVTIGVGRVVAQGSERAGSVEQKLAEARAGLKRAQERIVQARQAGRTLDYPHLRANLIEHALRVADMCADRAAAPEDATFFDPIRERAAAYAAQRAATLNRDIRTRQYRHFSIPHPDLHRPWSVRDGELLAGDEPVTLHGFVWQYSVKDHSYTLYDLGLNFQSIESGPRAYMPEPFTLAPDMKRADYVRHMRQAALQGQQDGEVFEIHTSPHYIPSWFERSDYGPNSYMETPEFRRMMDLHYLGLRRAYGDINAVKLADLANEWVFRSTSPEAMAGFHSWLRARYRSVAALNAMWGTHLADFADAPAPFDAQQDVPNGIYQRRAPLWDWCCYNAQRAARIVRWMNANLKLRYPGILTHIKCVLSSYAYRSLAGNFILGIDPERILPITDITGTDASYVFGDEWIKTLFAYDYLRSISPQKPIFCSESHAPFGDNPEGAGQIRRGLFQRFVHGERLNLMFLNTTLQVPEYWTVGQAPRWNFSQAPEFMEALALTSADLRRLTPHLRSFNRRKPSVLLFYDNCADFGIPGSDHPPGKYGERVLKVYESLLWQDVRVGVVTENMLQALSRSEAATHLPLLILAGATHVSDAAADCLARYVRAGGHLLLLGENLTHDAHGAERPDSEYKGLLAEDRARQLPLHHTSADYDPIWAEEFARADVDRPFSLDDASGGAVRGVEILSATHENGAPLVFVANGNRHAVDLQLRGEAAAQQAFTDLVTGRDVQPSRVHLERDGVVMLHAGGILG